MTGDDRINIALIIATVSAAVIPVLGATIDVKSSKNLIKRLTKLGWLFIIVAVFSVILGISKYKSDDDSQKTRDNNIFLLNKEVKSANQKLVTASLGFHKRDSLAAMRYKTLLDAINEEGYKFDSATKQLKPLPVRIRLELARENRIVQRLDDIGKIQAVHKEEERKMPEDQRKKNHDLWVQQLKKVTQSVGADSIKLKDAQKWQFGRTESERIKEIRELSTQLNRDKLKVAHYSDSVAKYQK